MILTGQYDSPYSRRVAISLSVLGFAFTHDKRSVFADFEAMRTVNPLARIPSLTLDSGEVLIDSSAILDWLDESVGPGRALVPRAGTERQRALQRIALACGTLDKFGVVAYESLIRPETYRWPEWIARCRTQAEGGLAALEAMDWPANAPVDQAQITTGCLLSYLKMPETNYFAPANYPRLAALSERMDARPEFIATRVSGYAVPRGGKQ